MIDPFTDAPSGGAIAIFTTGEAAAAFVDQDPFLQHFVVTKFTVREWNGALVS